MKFYEEIRKLIWDTLKYRLNVDMSDFKKYKLLKELLLQIDEMIKDEFEEN